ncbi:MAG: helix-turn-helix domain-containing protein [Cyanobacteria bacterium P01_F01_bin.143]
MNFNTKPSNLFPFSPEINFGISESLNPNWITTERIENSKSELEIIYIGENVVINLKQNDNRKSFLGFDIITAKRIKRAWEWEAEDELIACATASSDSLFVMGCDFEYWKIPFSSLPCFEKIPISERNSFKLDEDGSYLYWECADIHLDLENFKAVIDPEFRAKLLLEKQKYNESFGKAIQLLRKEYKLKQKDITNISNRHLRRIEKEGYQPTLDILKKLAIAHQLDLESYIEKVSEQLKTI